MTNIVGDRKCRSCGLQLSAGPGADCVSLEHLSIWTTPLKANLEGYKTAFAHKNPDIPRYDIVAEKGSDIFSAYTVEEDNADGSWVKYEDHVAALKAAKWWEHKRQLTEKQVLEEELMLCGLGSLDSFQSPFDALQSILDFHLDTLEFSWGER